MGYGTAGAASYCLLGSDRPAADTCSCSGTASGTYSLNLAEDNGITYAAGSLSSDAASDRWNLNCQLVSGKTANFIPLQTIIDTQ